MNSSFSTHDWDQSKNNKGARPSADDDDSGQTLLGSIKTAFRERPIAVLGITLGLGAVLGAIMIRRDKGLLLDLAHLAVRMAIVAKKP